MSDEKEIALILGVMAIGGFAAAAVVPVTAVPATIFCVVFSGLIGAMALDAWTESRRIAVDRTENEMVDRYRERQPNKQIPIGRTRQEIIGIMRSQKRHDQ